MRRFIIGILCLLLCVGCVSAAQLQVEDLDAQAVVNEDGTCRMTLTVEVEFTEPTARFVLPLSSEAQKVSASGAAYKVRRLDGVRSVIFQEEVGFLGTRTFVCSYDLPCGVENREEEQRFTLAFPEKGLDCPISHMKLTLQFPTPPEEYPVWESAYYQEVIDNYLRIRLEDTAVVADSTIPFQDQETLRMTLDFPEDTFRLRNLPGSITTVNQLVFYVLLLAALLYWFFALRGKLLLPKKQQQPGMETTAGEIPSRLFGEAADVAATLAHWGNLGYVSIYRNPRRRIILLKQMEMGNERNPAEQKLFEALFRGGNTCDLQSPRFRKLSQAAGLGLRSAWVRRIFEKRSGSPALLRGIGLLAGFFAAMNLFDLWLPAGGWRWLFLPLLSLLCVGLCALVQRGVRALLRPNALGKYMTAVIAAVLLSVFAARAGCFGLMLMNLLLQGFCGLLTLFGGKRTPIGNEQVRELLGLRRFLKKADAQELQELSAADGQYFYQMLPFAHVLGVGKAFVRRFGHHLPEPCIWLADAARRPSGTEEFYALYQEIFAAIRDESGKGVAILVSGRKR